MSKLANFFKKMGTKVPARFEVESNEKEKHGGLAEESRNHSVIQNENRIIASSKGKAFLKQLKDGFMQNMNYNQDMSIRI